MSKDERQALIAKLLADYSVDSQEWLRKALARRHVRVTQATLSRDFSEMRVAKVQTSEGVRYLVPDSPIYQRVYEAELQRQAEAAALRPVIQGVERLNVSGQVAALHTWPGYAAALAKEIDAAGVPEVLGTIAGHDTIFLLLMEGVDEAALRLALEPLLGAAINPPKPIIPAQLRSQTTLKHDDNDPT